MPSNQAAFLKEKETRLVIEDAAMPEPGDHEIVIKNRALAINPVDWHMQDAGIFIQEWPGILGSDVAGEVHSIGSAVTRFKPGDRVVGHSVTLTTGKARNGAFQLYTVVDQDKAAIIPDSITFIEAASIPLALGTAVAGLMLAEPGVGVFGIPTPVLNLPLPQLNAPSSGKTVVVYGGSSSVGSMAIQLARASGTKVIALASAKNFELLKQCGASAVVDYHDDDKVQKVATLLKEDKDRSFAGVFDAISIPETYKFDLELLELIGGGNLAISHPPPESVPSNVNVGMILGVTDRAAPVWTDFVTPALQSGALKCLPKQEIVGQGLQALQAGLDTSKAGVSATKLVVEL